MEKTILLEKGWSFLYGAGISFMQESNTKNAKLCKTGQASFGKESPENG